MSAPDFLSNTSGFSHMLPANLCRRFTLINSHTSPTHISMRRESNPVFQPKQYTIYDNILFRAEYSVKQEVLHSQPYIYIIPYLDRFVNSFFLIFLTKFVLDIIASEIVQFSSSYPNFTSHDRSHTPKSSFTRNPNRCRRITSDL